MTRLVLEAPAPLLRSRRLAEEVRQRKLPIVSGARINEVSLDQGAQAETFVQLAREEPSIEVAVAPRN